MADRIKAVNWLDKELFFIVLVQDVRSLVTAKNDRIPGGYFMAWDFQFTIPQDGKNHTICPGILPMHRAVRRLREAIVVKREEIDDGLQERLSEKIGWTCRGRFRDHVGKPPLAAKDPERIRRQFSACPELRDVLIEDGYEPEE